MIIKRRGREGGGDETLSPFEEKMREVREGEGIKKGFLIKPMSLRGRKRGIRRGIRGEEGGEGGGIRGNGRFV